MSAPPFSGVNMLCDDTGSIGYTAIADGWKQLDLLLDAYGRDNIFCIALVVENTVARALTIFYLLSKKVNFMLLNGHAPYADKIPFFCDLILGFPPAVPTTPDWPGSVRLIPNPACKDGGFAVKRRSGAVFFMSSGSTGAAKYIYYKQENLIRNARNCVKRFAIDHRSRILVPVPINHMYGMGVGLLPALIAGASICLIDKNNIIKLLDRLAVFKPDITLLTPAVIKMILLLKKNIDTSGIYITAGEKLNSQLFSDFESRYGRLYNLYGCTELGAIAVSEGDPLHVKGRSAGIVKPLDRVKIKIRPPENGPILCKHNAGYESYVDKDGVPIPAPKDEQGWHVLNDIGAAAGDTGFSVLGRVDNCINRYGFLISLDEIASFLESLFVEINQAIVFAGNQEEGLAPSLVAVCELVKGCELDVDTVKKICRDKTGKHLVPDDFHFVAEMPRLHNGKPDRASIITRYQ